MTKVLATPPLKEWRGTGSNAGFLKKKEMQTPAGP